MERMNIFKKICQLLGKVLVNMKITGKTFMLSCIPSKFIFSMLNLLIQMFCLSLKLAHISNCYWSVFLDSCYFIFHKKIFF